MLEAKREEEERKRREEAKALVADSIIREIATSACIPDACSPIPPQVC